MNRKNLAAPWLKKNVLFLAFVAIFVAFSILNHNFFTLNNLLNVTRQVSFVGIASVGMMCVILTGGIDLSIGSLTQVINVAGALFMTKAGMSWPFAVLCCYGIALASGILNGWLIAKIHMPPMIVTIASFNALNGVAFLLSGGKAIFGFPQGFEFLGQGYVWGIPFPTLVMILIFGAGAFILAKTYYGRCLYAIGGNEEAARLTGIRVEQQKFMAYVASALLACTSAVLRLSRLQSGTANTGQGFEFEVITAVVLGGVSVSGGSGKVKGVILGVLIIGMLNNGLTLLNLNTYWQYVLNGFVLVIAVVIDIMTRNRSNRIKVAA